MNHLCLLLPREEDLHRDESKMVYMAKDGKDEKTFGSVEWLATTCSNVPNKEEQMVRCHDYCNNVSRGSREKS